MILIINDKVPTIRYFLVLNLFDFTNFVNSMFFVLWNYAFVIFRPSQAFERMYFILNELVAFAGIIKYMPKYSPCIRKECQIRSLFLTAIFLS